MNSKKGGERREPWAYLVEFYFILFRSSQSVYASRTLFLRPTMPSCGIPLFLLCCCAGRRLPRIRKMKNFSGENAGPRTEYSHVPHSHSTKLSIHLPLLHTRSSKQYLKSIWTAYKCLAYSLYSHCQILPPSPLFTHPFLFSIRIVR